MFQRTSHRSCPSLNRTNKHADGNINASCCSLLNGEIKGSNSIQSELVRLNKMHVLGSIINFISKCRCGTFQASIQFYAWCLRVHCEQYQYGGVYMYIYTMPYSTACMRTYSLS